MPEPVDLNFVTTDVMGGSVLQWATPITNVKDMVDKAIAKLKPGECIRRLVIAGHGAEKTDGFMVFDADTTGSEYIDGSNKAPISPGVVSELQRLKAHFCKDAIIELRVCRFGIGKNGQKAMLALADAVGVPITAPIGEISSLAAIGGVATDWRVAYPTSWGMPVGRSFWRGSPTKQPDGAPDLSSIAPVTGQMIPLRVAPGHTNNFLTPPAVLPPIRSVSIADPAPPRVSRGAAVVGAVLVAIPVVVGVALNVAPTPTPVGAAPTATPTAAPTAAPTATATATPTVTAMPTAQPTPTPSPSPFVALVPPDGTYTGSGTFLSNDGKDTFESAWLVSIEGDEVSISQLTGVGGQPFRVTPGILDPGGVLVAVNHDPAFCDVMVLEFRDRELLPEMFVAYGPPAMTCPDPHDLATLYQTLGPDPDAREAALRDAYRWGGPVVVGGVEAGGWIFAP